MEDFATHSTDITLFHDLSLESKQAKDVLEIFRIPYTAIFSESEANWYLPFMFFRKNSYRIRGIQEIKSFLIEEIKKNKYKFYKHIKYENDYVQLEEDLWLLESLFGAEAFIEELIESKMKIDNNLINSLFQNSQLRFFISIDSKLLSTSISEFLEGHFGPLTEIEYNDYLKKFNLRQLEETKEKGYIKF